MWLRVLVFCVAVAVSLPSSNCTSGDKLSCYSWWKWDASKELCGERGCCWDTFSFPECFYPMAKQEIKKVHVIQGCHFDAGFVQSAPDIINLWWHQYFPLAYEVGEALEQQNNTSNARLHFTAQSWLVEMFLNCPQPYMAEGVVCPTTEEISMFKEAVQKGYITWHAFPFNGEAEIMNPSLFSFAINMTHTLDDKFSLPRKKTMSQRDVPGLTQSVIPLMLKQGVQALSVGVNGGSAPPNVPKAFIWKNGQTNQSIRAFWVQGGYAGIHTVEPFSYTQVPGSDQAMVLAWRGDNAGPPPTAQDVISDWEKLAKEFPGAEIVASTFDQYVDSVASIPDANFPVIEKEIGDTWIYGVASDPAKLREMRVLQSFREQCLESGECSLEDERIWNFSVAMLKNAEHTWGRDQKVALGDYVHSHWTNEEFDALKTTPQFVQYAYSWQRQRDMGVSDAIELLKDHPLASKINEEINSLRSPSPFNTSGWKVYNKSNLPETISLGGITVSVNSVDGSLKTSNAIFGRLAYRTYDNADYKAFQSHYNYGYPFVSADKYDFLKVDLPSSVNSSMVAALLSSVSVNGTCMVVNTAFPPSLNANFGAPVSASLRYCSVDGTLQLSIILENKRATRLPESITMFVLPQSCSNWSAMKLGSKVDIRNVQTGGSKHLHACDKIMCDSVTVTPLDSPLVSFGTSSVFPTPIDSEPDFQQGAYFVLHDNLWNTNYVMWYVVF